MITVAPAGASWRHLHHVGCMSAGRCKQVACVYIIRHIPVSGLEQLGPDRNIGCASAVLLNGLPPSPTVQDLQRIKISGSYTSSCDCRGPSPKAKQHAGSNVRTCLPSWVAHIAIARTLPSLSGLIIQTC
jgi:hypothetical protein